MLCVEQLPDDPATLKRMLIEQDSQLEIIHSRREAEIQAAVQLRVAAEIQAAVDEAVQAAVAKAIKETTALFCGAFTARGTNASIHGNSCCSA